MTEQKRIAPHSQPRLSFSVSPQAFAMLESMKTQGLWGMNRAEVARNLLYKSLQAFVEVDRLKIGGQE